RLVVLPLLPINGAYPFARRDHYVLIRSCRRQIEAFSEAIERLFGVAAPLRADAQVQKQAGRFQLVVPRLMDFQTLKKMVVRLLIIFLFLIENAEIVEGFCFERSLGEGLRNMQRLM